MDCPPAETVFATPELSALIAERAFDPEQGFTIEQLDAALPTASHGLATLASLARVNRALARMPWPSAAGTAHAALGEEAEAERRRLAPVVEGDAALTTRAAIKAKLELGLAAVARACGALDQELRAAEPWAADGLRPRDGGGSAHASAPAAVLAREPGSAAERAYRACVLYSAVDVLWRAAAPDSLALIALMPTEPPQQLALALCSLGTSARLPAELRAASFSTLGSVMQLLGYVVAHSQARLPRLELPAAAAPPELAAEQEQRYALAHAELSAVLGMLGGAIDSAACADCTLQVGPLGLALAAMFDFDGIDAACQPSALLLKLLPSLCALVANPRKPIGARTCAAAAIEQHADDLIEDAGEGPPNSAWKRPIGVFNELKVSGASESCCALIADVDRALKGGEAGRGHGQRSPPILVMPVSRSHLLFAARRLQRVAEHLQGMSALYYGFGGSDDDGDDDMEQHAAG